MSDEQPPSVRQPANPSFGISQTLIEAITAIAGTPPTALVDAVAGEIDRELPALIGDILPEDRLSLGRNPADKCAHGDASLLPACAAYEAACASALHQMELANAQLEDEFLRAVTAWETALQSYHIAISAADEELQHCIALARADQKKATEAAFSAENEYQIASLKMQILVAKQCRDEALAIAASTLASEAATLIGAHTNFVCGTKAVQVQARIEQATATQEFWQSASALTEE